MLEKIGMEATGNPVFINYSFGVIELLNFFESLLTEKEKLCESMNSTIFLFSSLAGVLFNSLLVTNGKLAFIAHAFILDSPFSDFSSCLIQSTIPKLFC